VTLTPRYVYKVVDASQWRRAVEDGAFHGSADDARDGFIHLSTAEQLEGTLRKHFAGQHDLVLVAFEADDLGGDLKWEASRGGALFPHLYAPLPTAHAKSVGGLMTGDDGVAMVPRELVR